MDRHLEEARARFMVSFWTCITCARVRDKLHGSPGVSLRMRLKDINEAKETGVDSESLVKKVDVESE